MKKILLLTLLGILSTGLYAQKIEWKTIEQAATTETKTNTRLYFVDFYTSWCGWCKKMDRETFTNPVVAKILNTYYIPVKFDAEGSAEFTWQGTRYGNTAQVPGSRPSTHNFAKAVLGPQMGFPSFGLFNSDQSKLTLLQGYQSADDLIVVLWYFASGDNRRYPFDKYRQIFDSTIRPTMNQRLGIE